jgi:hypothetical protein
VLVLLLADIGAAHIARPATKHHHYRAEPSIFMSTFMARYYQAGGSSSSNPSLFVVMT